MSDKNEKKLKIAMLGTKGIPATWGGIEKYVEEIGKRLVKRGHEVMVFGSRWYCKGYEHDSYMGMKLCKIPALQVQALDALSNAFLASIRVLRSDFDIVHFHGYASYYFVPLIRKMGKFTVITTHGVESGWDNPKYGFFARKIIQNAFSVGIRNANVVTTVATHLKLKIKETYNINAIETTSGINETTPKPPRVISENYGLHSFDYLLFLGRIDPIKRVDWLLDLSEILGKNLKIVIAGGVQNSLTEAYLQSIKDKAGHNPQIIFTGPVVDEEKEELLTNCRALLAPSDNEGLPITVLEAIDYGRCCIASDIPAHKEVIEDGVTGFLFSQNDKESFLKKVKDLLGMSKDYLEAIGIEAKRQRKAKFNW
jgi:glycosyltransferase involved in cell wall biosynthesis